MKTFEEIVDAIYNGTLTPIELNKYIVGNGEHVNEIIEAIAKVATFKDDKIEFEKLPQDLQDRIKFQLL